jgi:hypothetical protein
VDDERELLIAERKRELLRSLRQWEVQETLYAAAFLFMRAIGVIWLAKRIRLPLQQWVKDRDDGTIPLP